MALPTPKELKALATTCRKLGIKTFRSGEFEFTLSDELPAKVSKKSQSKALFTNPSENSDIETDEVLSHEALLFWSSANPAEEEQDGIMR